MNISLGAIRSVAWMHSEGVLRPVRNILIASASIGWLTAPAPIVAQEVAPRQLERPVGQLATPYAVFLDIAWQRSLDSAAEAPALLEEAFAAAQRDQTSLAAQAIKRLASQLGEGAEPRAQSLRALQESEERVLELQRQVRAAADERKFSAVRQLSAELAAAVRKVEAEQTALIETDPRYRSLLAEVPVSTAQIRADLKPGEAFLFVAQGADHVYIFAVDPQGATWFKSELSPHQLDREVTALRCEMAMPACGLEGPAPRFDRARAHRLYRALIEPALADRLDVQVLNIVPNRTLSRLPLAALVTGTPSGSDADDEALRQTKWLVDRYASSVAPSPAAFHLLRSLGEPRSAPSFEGFGKPDIEWFADPQRAAETAAATQGNDPDLLRGLRGAAPTHDAIAKVFKDLTETEPELRALAKATGASEDHLHLGQSATETALKNFDLSGTSVLAIATHGVLAGQIDGVPEPSLIMSIPRSPLPDDDAVLAASEVAGLKLGADLVVLSACETAGPSGREGAAGDGLSGLARAFFVAGARSLLVSHWEIYDDVAPLLTVATVRAAPDQLQFARVKALQRAMIEVRNDRDLGRAHPSAWAPLVLVGDAR